VIKGYKIGATDYIIKPFHPETLKLKIEGYLKAYQDREFLELLVRERTVELEAKNKQLLQEVNERKIIAEKLMASSKKFNNILESISDAFISVVFPLSCNVRNLMVLPVQKLPYIMTIS